MKKLILMLFALVTFATVTNAQGKYGLGIIVGEPTGISGKMKVSSVNSFDAAIGWSFNKYSSLHIHGDYLFNVLEIGKDFPLYIGIGGRIKMSENKGDDSKLGARFPIGVVYQPSTKPFDLFIESVPLLNLTPKSEFDWNAAAGVRFYFD